MLSGAPHDVVREHLAELCVASSISLRSQKTLLHIVRLVLQCTNDIQESRELLITATEHHSRFSLQGDGSHSHR